MITVSAIRNDPMLEANINRRSSAILVEVFSCNYFAFNDDSRCTICPYVSFVF